MRTERREEAASRRDGADRGAHGASLPVLRLMLACRDAEEFRQEFLPRYREQGVFVAVAGSVRPVGERVLLRVELLDGSTGFSGEAVVAAHERAGSRSGVRVRLEAPEKRAPPESSPGTTEPLGAKAEPLAVGLAEYFFADLPPPSRDAEPDEDVGRSMPSAALPARLAPEVAARLPKRLGGAAVPSSSTVPVADDRGIGSERRPAVRAAGASSERSAASSRAAVFSRRWVRFLLLMAALGVGVVAVALFATGAHRAGDPNVATLSEELRRADVCLRDGRLAGASSDTALGHLLAAQGLRPGEEQVAARLRLLAEKLEELATDALKHGDLDGATAHCRAATQADPTRASLRTLVEQIEVQRRLAKKPELVEP